MPVNRHFFDNVHSFTSNIGPNLPGEQTKNTQINMDHLLETGQLIGRKHYAYIAGRSARWQARHVPAYIREHLMVPYYFAPGTAPGSLSLWVIQIPLVAGEKVHFLRSAELHEKEVTQIPPGPE